jgi:phage terminase large subunit
MMPHVPVSSIGDFCNAIFRGEILNVEIEIGENCKTSINDYIQSKTDKDGAILKELAPATATMPAHQKNGHLVDTLKDMIAQAFRKEYEYFKNSKPKKLQTGYFR